MNPNTYQQNFSVPPIQQQPSTSMQPYVQNNQGGYYQPQPVPYQHNAGYMQAPNFQNSGQYSQTQQWSSHPPAANQYYNNSYMPQSNPMPTNQNQNNITTHQNQVNHGYQPLQNNVKAELPLAIQNVASTSSNAQWTTNFSPPLTTPNMVATTLPTPKLGVPTLPVPKTGLPNLPTPKNCVPKLPTPKTGVPKLPASKADSNLENSTYKNWKLKYSTKDSSGFHCLVCQGKSFTADSSLKRHYKQAHEQTCKTCKMQFSEECILNQHIKDKHEFRCSICSKVFSASSSLKRHHDQQHGGAMPNQQQQITQATHTNSSQFQTGNEIKSSPSKMNPEFTGQGYLNSSSSNNMNSFHVQNSNLTASLEKCSPMQFKNEEQYSNLNNASPSKPLASAVCKSPKDKTLKFPSPKKPSTNNTSSTPKKPGTSTPKKEGPEDNAFSIQQWREWKGKYTANDSNGFHCLVCPGKSYSTERALLRHYKQVHELICAQCRICFSEENLLKQHRKETHEFWCFPCSKVYTTSRALRRHNQQQHGISQSKSVTYEQIGKIPEEKTDDGQTSSRDLAPYNSNPAAVKPSSSKKSAVKSSTPKKEKQEYWCQPCNRKFAQRASLQRHQNQHHSQQINSSSSENTQLNQYSATNTNAPVSITNKTVIVNQIYVNGRYSENSGSIDSGINEPYGDYNGSEGYYQENYGENYSEEMCDSNQYDWNSQNSNFDNPAIKTDNSEYFYEGENTYGTEGGSQHLNWSELESTKTENYGEEHYTDRYKVELSEDYFEDTSTTEHINNSMTYNYEDSNYTEEQLYGNQLETHNGQMYDSSFQYDAQQNGCYEGEDPGYYNHNGDWGTNEQNSEEYQYSSMDGANNSQSKSKDSSGSFQCSQCTKTFSNKSNMMRHFNSTHCFPCKVCKQKFVDKTMMETHYKQEHMINCNICGKTFSNKSNLQRHVKTAHVTT